MKYHVKIQGRSFKVSIDNLHTQPIIANVDGEPIEVWIENQVDVNSARSDKPVIAEGAPSKSGTNGLASINKTIRAPIPGTIISVSVHTGDEVAIGQQLCVLEAMKMKNAIRSPRKGVIASVHVSAGQTVQHHDELVEFVD
jgi:glutaconyl-CoA/methylmalonyl-CoA decarboxylase subunit gamma